MATLDGEQTQQVYQIVYSLLAGLTAGASYTFNGDGTYITVSTVGTTVTTTLAIAALDTHYAGLYQPLDSDLTAVAGLAGTGYIIRTGAGTATTRSISGGTYISVSNGDGVAGATSADVNISVLDTHYAAIYQPLDSDLTALAALSTTGLVVRTGAGTATTRALTSGTYITITNADGVSAAPNLDVAIATLDTHYAGLYQPLDSDLTALAALAGGAYAVQTAVGAWSQRTFGVGSNKLAVTNGSGVAGNTSYDVNIVGGQTWDFSAVTDVKVPTAVAGDNDTSAASTAFVTSAVAALNLVDLGSDTGTGSNTSLNVTFTASTYCLLVVVLENVVSSTSGTAWTLTLRSGTATAVLSFAASTAVTGTNAVSGWAIIQVGLLGATLIHSGLLNLAQVTGASVSNNVTAFGANASVPDRVRFAPGGGNIQTNGKLRLWGLKA